MAAWRSGMWIFSVLLRLFLIVYGEWQDSHMEVPYSDIDYTVFSDAAAFMAQGRSPYIRDTYRYSPLLALILTPNVWLHRCWGKILFSTTDLLVGWLIYRLLRLQRIGEDVATLCAGVFLFNPFTFTIGTRGNCEAIPCAMILWLAMCLLQGRKFEAALWYGLVVHFRIYPIIYALPFVLYLSNKRLITRDSIVFAVASGIVFVFLTLVSYTFYGAEFLNEALLYHLTRVDPRHNFSIYFYPIYLHQDKDFTVIERLASFLPQLSIQIIFAIFYSQDIPFCLFIQTVAFVALNKVVTAQYFVWYLCLLPLVLPFTSMRLRWKGIICIGIWTVAQLHWLAWAYLLEFRGKNVLLQLWIASLVFFAANVFVLSMLLYHHKVINISKLQTKLD